MRKPNDKKRPNTKGSAETAARKRNFKYVHVSKRILEVPVLDPVTKELTNIKQLVAEKHGSTYTRSTPKKKNKHERAQDRLRNTQGS